MRFLALLLAVETTKAKAPALALALCAVAFSGCSTLDYGFADSAPPKEEKKNTDDKMTASDWAEAILLAPLLGALQGAHYHASF